MPLHGERQILASIWFLFNKMQTCIPSSPFSCRGRPDFPIEIVLIWRIFDWTDIVGVSPAIFSAGYGASHLDSSILIRLGMSSSWQTSEISFQVWLLYGKWLQFKRWNSMEVHVKQYKQSQDSWNMTCKSSRTCSERGRSWIYKGSARHELSLWLRDSAWILLTWNSRRCLIRLKSQFMTTLGDRDCKWRELSLIGKI